MRVGRFLTTVLSCFCLVALVHPAPLHAETPPQVVEGLVVGVAEGDRITVNSFGTEIHVQLYGIAAPQPARMDKYTGWYKPGQPYAEEAFRALSSKILHQVVKVEIRRNIVLKNDQVALAVVYLDHRNINLEMLAEGWGWAYRRFLNRADHAHYLGAEKYARSKKTGLWSQDNPQAPWDYRPNVRLRRHTGG
ncbi:thermonuclease family protein [Geomonas sp. Red32]|uniref:thermonuclease family protein n=1 Tax=Geomonas sp. Red32 TaxID=2912856 RepID=UPI00202D0B61|nr:thermonuclease family protein [Geomonas sp. Red32]MCM0083288.1 thermonuclease family protein [Geomonas sp. Red32]